jgi:hypothetical protein
VRVSQQAADQTSRVRLERCRDIAVVVSITAGLHHQRATHAQRLHLLQQQFTLTWHWGLGTAGAQHLALFVFVQQANRATSSGRITKKRVEVSPARAAHTHIDGLLHAAA